MNCPKPRPAAPVTRARRRSAIIILITAGPAVDQTIAVSVCLLPSHTRAFACARTCAHTDGRPQSLRELLEAGDLIIDGGNEWYTNTERRANELKPFVRRAPRLPARPSGRHPFSLC